MNRCLRFARVTDDPAAGRVVSSSVTVVNRNIDSTSVVITNNAGTTTYVKDRDYWVNSDTGSITHIASADGGTMVVPATNIKVDYRWSSLADDEYLYATYNYTPSDLNLVHEWSDVNDIINFYGPPMAGDNIYSDISLAATLMGQAIPGAILPTIKTLAVSPNENPAGNSSAVESSDYAYALTNKLSSQEDVTYLIVLSQDPQVWAQISAFVENQASGEQHLIRAWTGPGQGFGILSRAAGDASILGLNTKRMVITHAEQIPWLNYTTGNQIQLPGYYAAAVLAAEEVVREVWQPMHSRMLLGFQQFKGNQLISSAQKNRLATSGVTVLENGAGGIRIRDCITTKRGNIEDEEPSIVRALDYLARDINASFSSLRESIDLYNDDLSRQKISDATEQRLQLHAIRGTIISYKDIAISLLGGNPRTWQIRAQLTPRVPVKNLDFKLTVVI